VIVDGSDVGGCKRADLAYGCSLETLRRENFTCRCYQPGTSGGGSGFAGGGGAVHQTPD
jgi:hypothetical protein